jgi:mRNA-degrading endonuclease RelE of RelBE toxin-antitoxin system
MIGMAYKILPTKEFSKDFKKLDSQIQKRVKLKFEEVAEDPKRYKFLHYDLKGSCRLWIGKLRIIFSYDKNKNELYAEKIIIDHKYRG